MSPREATRVEDLMVKSVSWMAGIKWFSQVLSWGTTLFIVRILTPNDYGIFGLAAVYVGLVAMLMEFGLGSAIVNMRNLSASQLAQINTVSLLMGLTCFAFSWCAAEPISRILGSAKLQSVIIALSTTFIIKALWTVPHSLLRKDMRFRSIAVFEGIEAVLLSICLIVLAMMGYAYWALVLAYVLSALVRTFLAVISRPCRFALPKFTQVKGILSFSRDIIVARLSWYTYSKADIFIVGQTLGTAATGAYELARTVARIPVEKITGLITTILPPFLSSAQNEDLSLRKYMVKVTQGLSIITFPLTIALFIFAEDIVILFFGENWLIVITPLRVLAASSTLNSIEPLFSQMIVAKQETEFLMKINLFAAITMPICFWGASQWGTGGIAMVWLLINPVCQFPLYRKSLQRIELPWSGYLRCLWPATNGVVFMGLVIFLLRKTMADDVHSIPILLIQSSAGGVTYVAVLLAFHRNVLRQFYDLITRQRILHKRNTKLVIANS